MSFKFFLEKAGVKFAVKLLSAAIGIASKTLRIRERGKSVF